MSLRRMSFTLSIGQAVTDGEPAAGAGNIETSGVVDRYHFSGTTGQVVYFDEQSGDCLTLLFWECVAPDGSTLFRERLGGLSCGTDAGAKALPATGAYIRAIRGEQSATGSYAFQLWNVPIPQAIELAVGQSVTNDVPIAGAGNIETPGSQDVYRFAGIAGQSIYFDEQSGDCLTPLR